MWYIFIIDEIKIVFILLVGFLVGFFLTPHLPVLFFIDNDELSNWLYFDH